MKYLLFNWDTIEQEINDPSELTNKEFEKIAELIYHTTEDFESAFNAEHFSVHTHQLRIVTK